MSNIYTLHYLSVCTVETITKNSPSCKWQKPPFTNSTWTEAGFSFHLSKFFSFGNLNKFPRPTYVYSYSICEKGPKTIIFLKRQSQKCLEGIYLLGHYENTWTRIFCYFCQLCRNFGHKLPTGLINSLTLPNWNYWNLSKTSFCVRISYKTFPITKFWTFQNLPCKDLFYQASSFFPASLSPFPSDTLR